MCSDGLEKSLYIYDLYTQNHGNDSVYMNMDKIMVMAVCILYIYIYTYKYVHIHFVVIPSILPS